MEIVDRKELEKAIHRSQHCQRNWDLSKQIPEHDLEVLTTAITQCPSKQNIAFYQAHLVTDRDLIEAVHAKTNGFVYDPKTGASTTNSQTLANLLVVFEEKDVEFASEADTLRNTQSVEHARTQGAPSEQTRRELERDRDMAIGIAAGYLNLSASLLGYSTGCCLCFDGEAVRDILGLKKRPALLMGIGFKNAEVGRRMHHADPSFVFPTLQKQEIKIRRV